jgi:hypothetical protein
VFTLIVIALMSRAEYWLVRLNNAAEDELCVVRRCAGFVGTRARPRVCKPRLPAEGGERTLSELLSFNRESHTYFMIMLGCAPANGHVKLLRLCAR